MVDELAAAYSRDGVAAVRGVLGPDELEQLAAALDYAQQHPSPMASNLSASVQGTFFNDFNTWRRNPHVAAIARSEALLSVARDVVGCSSVRLFHDHILAKSGMSSETPWHQDRPYYFVAGPRNFSIWMSPECVVAEEGLAFAAGSHLLEKLFVPVNFKDGTPMEEPEGMQTLDPARLAEVLDACPPIGFDLDPGDLLVFDNRIVHMARRSKAPVDRRALSIRYLGDGATLTWLGVNQTPPFHRMGLRFEEGDLPADPWFPLLWP